MNKSYDRCDADLIQRWVKSAWSLAENHFGKLIVQRDLWPWLLFSEENANQKLP